LFIDSKKAMLPEGTIEKLVYPDVTDDQIFGALSNLNMRDYFDQGKLEALRGDIEQADCDLVIVAGLGASVVCDSWDMLIYADMARWEIQHRMKRNEVNNLGVSNKEESFSLLYKQAYFVDWRVCDRLKKALVNQIDYVLDSNTALGPKMISGETFLEGLKITSRRPFSVVPFFEPGPWGGQWMKEKFDLDKSAPNYAWCFNGVPEENSLLLHFYNAVFETPSINLVFFQSRELLGEQVFDKFGDEFPIRFDFLDTMGGGNLSLQVHPLTAYIKDKFGMSYTQDESYYMMDVGEGAVVYLGFNEGVNPVDVISDLEAAENGDTHFDAEKHVSIWPVKKHDHVLIPAGTIHCSGSESMVLEISATPYIFTFKLWDWARLGMDGKPRPINIAHGKEVLQWDRVTSWTKENLINQIEVVAKGDGWVEEKTGLHELEFIETRRHWFSQSVNHHTGDTVHVICLIEGETAIVESPDNAFEPFVVNYAEVFIVPAQVGPYTIRPFGASEGMLIGTLKAYVRK
jgi:mannose-6-phosphate isomerase class I